MQFTLGIRASRILSLGFVLLALICAGFSLRSTLAHTLSARDTPADLNRTVPVEQENAAYWRQLALTRLYRETDASGALEAFRRATELNPRDADSWLGTAYAFEYLGDAKQEQIALSHALAVAPKRLEIIWQAGNLYVGLGDYDAMRAQVCTVVQHDPVRAAAASELLHRMTPSGSSFACAGENPR